MTETEHLLLAQLNRLRDQMHQAEITRIEDEIEQEKDRYRQAKREIRKRTGNCARKHPLFPKE